MLTITLFTSQIFTNEGEYKTSIRNIEFYPRRLVLDTFHCYVNCNVKDGALLKITKTHKQILKMSVDTDSTDR